MLSEFTSTLSKSPTEPSKENAPAIPPVQPKADSFVAHEMESGRLELADIVDVQMIRSLMEHFYDLAHMPMAILDTSGKVLVGVGWQEICTKFHRVHPETCKNCTESDTQLTVGIAEGETRLYRCKNNMWDIATPIVVGGRHLGNLFSGQFLLEGESIDCEFFCAQAKRYGFDEKKYLAAVEAVPRLSRKKLDAGMAFLMKLAQMLSQMGYTNLKLAQSLEETKQAQARATEREIWFQTLFETIPLSAALIDTSTLEFLQFNDAAAENLGYTREEFAKLTVFDIEASLSPDQVREVSPEGNTLPVVLETKHRTKSGAVREVVVYIRNMTIHGRHVGNCVWQDITEKNAAEAALIEREKLASAGRMAATVAHEINNPLAAAINCVYLIGRDDELPARLRMFVEMAERELNRTAHITRQTLGFYREDTKPSTVDIRALTAEMADVYKSKLRPKHLSLNIEQDERCAGTIAIAGEIRQVISNLLANAIDASYPKGQIRVRISRVTLNQCSYTRVTVADTGVGIPAANRSQIFRPFFTTKEKVGTGLGLWVSTELVQKHKGRLRMRSVEGKGSVFSVFLPQGGAGKITTSKSSQ